MTTTTEIRVGAERCKHCRLPITYWKNTDILRDGTPARGSYWMHYDLVFETERGIRCPDNQTVAAPGVGRRWWHRFTR